MGMGMRLLGSYFLGGVLCSDIDALINYIYTRIMHYPDGHKFIRTPPAICYPSLPKTNTI